MTGQLCVDTFASLPDAQKRREKVLNDRMAKSRKVASLKSVAVDNYQWQRVISSDSSGSFKNRGRSSSYGGDGADRRSTTSPVRREFVNHFTFSCFKTSKEYHSHLSLIPQENHSKISTHECTLNCNENSNTKQVPFNISLNSRRVFKISHLGSHLR